MISKENYPLHGAEGERGERERGSVCMHNSIMPVMSISSIWNRLKEKQSMYWSPFYDAYTFPHTHSLYFHILKPL